MDEELVHALGDLASREYDVLAIHEAGIDDVEIVVLAEEAAREYRSVDVP